jgi:hypothetical protein
MGRGGRTVWYGTEDFIRDFHAQVVDMAEIVRVAEKFATLRAFRKARVRDLVFQDTDALPEEEARRIFWERLCDVLGRERGRRFRDDVDARALRDPENRDRKMEEFLGMLFTFLERTEGAEEAR